MLVWLTMPFYDFCGFRFVAVDSVYKLRFFTFIIFTALDVPKGIFAVLYVSVMGPTRCYKTTVFTFISNNTAKRMVLSENELDREQTERWQPANSSRGSVDKNNTYIRQHPSTCLNCVFRLLHSPAGVICVLQ